ncbi:MAG: cysteine desulfurase [Chitinophagales bacterium]|nr:cysteine desulfurase [Chitinophagales bacterium]
MSVYLDNAATTALDADVLNAMLPFYHEVYGNPSSQHEMGRKAKSAIEEARKTIAGLINANQGEIVFTSCGTESNNTILKCAVRDLGVKHIISTPIEHHCVLHTLEYLSETHRIKITILPVDNEGRVDMEQLERQLSLINEKTLVSIIHANNEVGTMSDMDAIANVCDKYDVLYHADTVQSFAHYKFDVKKTPVHFLSASAHKFHGPKGVGFFYMKGAAKVHSFIHGGGQERGYRAGTENVAGIVGMAYAAKMAYEHLENDREHILGLKNYLREEVKKALPDVELNGVLDDNQSLFTVLSLSLPTHPSGSLLLFKLDMQGIYVSGSSACSSGASVGSHVLASMGKGADRIPLRCSFSKYNTKEDVDILVKALKNLYEKTV